jgi:hypothetical protein
MSETDDEVRAWTETFVKYFLPTYMNREGWLPLIGYYEGASAGARTTACNATVAFANRLPTTAAAGRRAQRSRQVRHLAPGRLRDSATASKQLIVDLSARLGIAASLPSSQPQSACGCRQLDRDVSHRCRLIAVG